MKKLGKYEISEEIGRGGFAVVYKARDTALGRDVALKVLKPYWTDEPGFAARFRREACAVAKLCHPNIVTVYETGEIEGQLYIAMESLPGRSLRALLEAEGVLSLERALSILEQVAQALDYAQAQGVVHRDIKPDNVMVEETEHGIRATLMDFGLVKAMDGSVVLTSEGTLLGSPEYMAPEQADPARTAEISSAADRYALGIVAYHILTGRVPFPGNTPATLNAHENKPVPPPRSLRPDLPEAVEASLLKMLAKAPTDRFASARAFVARLREAILTESLARQQDVQLASLYERLQAAVAEEDWSEVVALGRQIQKLAVDYQEVPHLIALAHRKLRHVRRGLIPAWVWIASASVVLAILVGVVSQQLGGEEPDESPKASTEALSVLETNCDGHGCNGDVQTRPIDDMVMVYVPGGIFRMGSTDAEIDAALDRCEERLGNSECSRSQYERESPDHLVTLDGFWFDKTEVTNAQYNLCVENEGCEPVPHSDEFPYSSDNHPVVSVTWQDAVNYCTWAGGRLPTEAEWEYAARGMDERVYPWGNHFSCTGGNFDDSVTGCNDGYAKTAPVGQFPEGAAWCSALDVAGNVWEWVGDWYGRYPSAPQTNPVGPTTGKFRVLRGGSWVNSQMRGRSLSRSEMRPDAGGNYVGFRCVVLPAD